jgi:hypothetical protein
MQLEAGFCGVTIDTGTTLLAGPTLYLIFSLFFYHISLFIINFLLFIV